MAVRRELLWCVLDFVGIDVAGFDQKARSKCLLYAVRAILILFSLLVGKEIANYLLIRDVVEGLAYACLFTFVILIWFSLLQRKSEISYILRELYLYEEEYLISNTLVISFANCITISVILLPIFLCILIQTSGTPEEIASYVSCFAIFGFKIDNKDFARFLSVFMNIAYYTLLNLPLLLMFALCTIICRWAAVLENYNKLMQFQVFPMRNKKSKAILTEYYSIINVLTKLKQTLSFPSFLINAFSLVSIFVSIYYINMFKESIFSRTVTSINTLYTFTNGIIILLAYTLCSSKIPENLSEVKKTAKKLIFEQGSKFPTCVDPILFSLKEIEREDILYLDVWGMFNITRGFILSAIGATLTYDLLILNFK